MLKKYAEVLYEGKPIFVCNIKECTAVEFYNLKKAAEENLKVVLKLNNYEYLQLKHRIDALETINKDLERQIKVLRGED